MAFFIIAAASPLAASEDPQGSTLLDALDQDFDAYVATIDADALRALPRSDALYLLSQAVELADLEADYHAQVIAAYSFGGSPKDLDMFVDVAKSASPELLAAYCAKVSERLSGDLPADCPSELAQVFATQYGRGIPEVRYSPAILDVLYEINPDDIFVVDGRFGHMSGARAARFLELNEDAKAEDHLPALANSVLCSGLTRDIAPLKDLRSICRLLDPSDALKDEARQYALVGAVVDMCEGQESFRRCFNDLLALHNMTNRCAEPVSCAPVEGWYASKFFRTCLAGFLRR